MIEPIRIPDATLEPAAYVRALVATLGDREVTALALDGGPSSDGDAHLKWTVVQLAVLGVDAGVEDRDHDAAVAPRRGPGPGYAHPVVVPLEDALGVGHAQE